MGMNHCDDGAFALFCTMDARKRPRQAKWMQNVIAWAVVGVLCGQQSLFPMAMVANVADGHGHHLGVTDAATTLENVVVSSWAITIQAPKLMVQAKLEQLSKVLSLKPVPDDQARQPPHDVHQMSPHPLYPERGEVSIHRRSSNWKDRVRLAVQMWTHLFWMEEFATHALQAPRVTMRPRRLTTAAAPSPILTWNMVEVPRGTTHVEISFPGRHSLQEQKLDDAVELIKTNRTVDPHDLLHWLRESCEHDAKGAMINNQQQELSTSSLLKPDRSPADDNDDGSDESSACLPAPARDFLPLESSKDSCSDAVHNDRLIESSPVAWSSPSSTHDTLPIDRTDDDAPATMMSSMAAAELTQISLNDDYSASTSATYTRPVLNVTINNAGVTVPDELSRKWAGWRRRWLLIVVVGLLFGNISLLYARMT